MTASPPKRAEPKPRDLLARALRDFEWYAEECLKVEDKQTLQLVPLALKPVQVRLARVIIGRYLEGRPVRIRILKARREGVSTVVQAIFFWIAALRKYQSAVIIAHHDDATKTLHGISERFYSHLPEWCKPMRRASRRGEVLELAAPDGVGGLQSTLRTVTFKSAGASQAANLMHRSELGLWGEDGRAVIGIAEQIVPFAARTIVVDESTAKGLNIWFELWNQASPDPDADGWIQFFIPWFEEPTAVLEPHEDLGDLDAEEQELRDRFGVSDAQLAWRRWVGIPVLCNGDLDTFHEMYPAWPEQAFLASGRPYFNQAAVKRHLDLALESESMFRGDVVEDDESISVRANRRGPLRVWVPPVDGEDYILVCDPSEGGEGDPQNVYVSPRSRLELVAEWNGRVPRDELGDVLYCLGRIYNTALAVVEMSGGWGHSPIAVLRHRGYERIYQRRSLGRRRERREVKLGWETTNTNRPLILDKLDEALRKDDITCNSPELLRECQTFIISESGKPEAQPGCHDDRVVSSAVLVHLWQTEAVRRQGPRMPPRHVLSDAVGY